MSGSPTIYFDNDTQLLNTTYNVKFTPYWKTKIIIGTYREEHEYKYIIGKLVEVGNNIFMPVWVDIIMLQRLGQIRFVVSDDIEFEAGTTYSATERTNEMNLCRSILEKWY